MWQTILVQLQNMTDQLEDLFHRFSQLSSVGLRYTAVCRWIFLILSLFIVGKTIVALLRAKSPAEVWAYFNVNDSDNHPITHWENAVGRAKSNDIRIPDPAASRSHGTLSRDDRGRWFYMDLGSRNGTSLNGEKLAAYKPHPVEPGDRIEIGESVCTLFPTSLEEKRNNMHMRQEETLIESPWPSLLALTLFQFLTTLQLAFSLGEDFQISIALSYGLLCILMWVYVLLMRAGGKKGFEAEILAFYLAGLSLAVTAGKFPGAALKQAFAIAAGLLLFVFMCSLLRNLERTKRLRRPILLLAVLLLFINILFGKSQYGAINWISLGGLSVQPSEIIKIAFIWLGAASLDELMERRNSLVFVCFSGFCFLCLAWMGDFGTAMIFFVTFLVISFLRSGDFTKLILLVGIAFAGGLMVLQFKSYVAARFQVWGHVWDFADSAGYQQTRTMSAISSGGLIGVGAGGGWLKQIPASETDLVFGYVSEEWGLLVAVLAVLAIVTLSIFAIRSIRVGRSTYYTIAACSAMSLFLFQTILNVFGSVDLFPLTGVTFPFLSTGGTSMVASWGLLAFLKAADTRYGASFAIAEKDKGSFSFYEEEGEEDYQPDGMDAWLGTEEDEEGGRI